MTKAIFPQKRSISQAKRTALIGQGQRMSNWLYNIKQESSTPERLREEAKLLQEAWDRIKGTP
jgi:hypothetical protein